MASFYKEIIMAAATRPISPAPYSVLRDARRRCAAVIIFVLASAPCSLVIAGGRTTPANVEARYQSERAACDGRQSAEDRAACLRETAAVRDAAKRGQLDDPPGAYERNALARCEALPQADRDICRRRARGEGVTTGSVSGGGILREYREITLPPVEPKNGVASEPSTTNAPGNPPGEQKYEGK
jgi:hypothetical protein